MKRLTTRDLVYIAVFGALWGAMEITLGSYLHAVFPQGVTPIVGAGTIMTAIGIIVALVGWLFVPRTGAVLMIGVVAAILKGFSISGVKLSPMLAIVIECLLVEVGLLMRRDPRRWGFALAGALALMWTFFHKIFGSYVFLGESITDVYTGMVRQGAQALGIDPSWAIAIIALFLLIRIVMGGLAGWLAWELGGSVRRRLARE